MTELKLSGQIYKVLEPQQFANGRVKQSLILRVPQGKYNQHFMIDFYEDDMWMAKSSLPEQKVEILCVLEGSLTKDTTRCFHNLKGTSIINL